MKILKMFILVLLITRIFQALKNIASKGKTVICTIHQPSSELFSMFDRVLLMAEGRTAYLGQANEALSFFAGLGIPCPPNYNPADFFIHTLATVPGQEAESKKKSGEICSAYELSDNGKQMLEQLKANRPSSVAQQGPDMPPVETKRSPYKASWLAQFRAVLWRSVLTVLREPAILRAKAFQSIVSDRSSNINKKKRF
jgi:ABC-type multidrug transport system ATPase subunit